MSDFRPAGRKLAVRLASSEADIIAAQRLRYRIFVEMMGAAPRKAIDRRDVDPYDPLCDHLLVEDLALPDAPVIGTYRLLRQSIADAHQGFYSADEFDLGPVLRHAAREGAELLELGRSCVDPAYRDAGTIQLLWRGIADYLVRHRIGYMFGCGSFPGTDPAEHAASLSLLAHDHLALANCVPGRSEQAPYRSRSCRSAAMTRASPYGVCRRW